MSTTVSERRFVERTIAFITLGCAKNDVDSNHMKDALRSAGWQLVDEAERARVIVVNTCAFIEAAAEESIEMILDAADTKRVRDGECALIVSGCLPSRYGEDLAEALPEIRHFLPVDSESSIIEMAERAFGELGDTRAAKHEGAGDEALELDRIDANPVFSYVKIADGCDRHCSYCTIPSIRGPYASLSADEIEEEVRAHVCEGAREIVLIAQDSGRWGRDLKPQSTLAELLERLATTFPSTWFRVMYLQPEGVSAALLEVMAAHPNICPYFDIPLQHCDPDVLRRMNRSGSPEVFHGLFADIKAALPDAAIRTTLIAGFPGETDEQFERLCDFLRDEPIDYVGVFPYSREEGTEAALLDDQIAEEVKIERANTLRTLADEVCASRLRRFLGRSAYVLMEGKEPDGVCFGRTMFQAPEVDGVTYGGSGQVGEVVELLLTDSLIYDMEGE